MEKKWFSIYSPVSYNLQKQLTWGAGSVWGRCFVGWAPHPFQLFGKKEYQRRDFHIGLSVPVFQHGVFKKKKEEKKEEEEARKEEVKQVIKQENLVKTGTMTV